MIQRLAHLLSPFVVTALAVCFLSAPANAVSLPPADPPVVYQVLRGSGVMDPVVREPFTASTPAEAAAAHAAKVAERRATVVAVAEQYLGVPYVLGGASGYGIDCSGLTMVAYAAIGIPLFHLVSSQDAVGTPIPLSAIQPGDLLVFDDHEHIAMFVGGGTIIQAPEPGRTVELTPISDWSGVAFHAIRLIS